MTTAWSHEPTFKSINNFSVTGDPSKNYFPGTWVNIPTTDPPAHNQTSPSPKKKFNL